MLYPGGFGRSTVRSFALFAFAPESGAKDTCRTTEINLDFARDGNGRRMDAGPGGLEVALLAVTEILAANR